MKHQQQKKTKNLLSEVTVTLEMTMDYFGKVLREDAYCTSVTTYRVFPKGTRVLHQAI